MFGLTDALVRRILFAMEDQTEESVLLVAGGVPEVVPLASISGGGPEDVVPLPGWGPSDGFNLLEEFVGTLRAASARDELGAALLGGRGVFKNFKNVLRRYPEVAARFARFKERRMRSRVSAWYNALREAWGLEGLPVDGVEEPLDDLVGEDFSFAACDFLTDGRAREEVLAGHEKIAGEFAASPEDGECGAFGGVLADLWRERRVFMDSPRGFVCRTLAGDFVGCIVYCRLPHSRRSPTDARESAALTTCFVDGSFRGLGIARKLFSMCCAGFRSMPEERRVRDFVVADSMVPEPFSRVLLDMGFVRVRSLYVARFS